MMLMKVLNIIAELKLPHRKEVIATLKQYGFRCLKYAESYNMYFPSDHYMKIENARMVFERAERSQPPINCISWYPLRRATYGKLLGR
jgi:hypothetical protein